MTKPKRPAPPDLRQIRRALLTAVASDDLLVELLVLKGGNALELIHRIGERASLDLDFSMEGDAKDVDELEARLRRAVEDRLDSLGLIVFDWKFGPRPATAREGMQRWGGYRAGFKVIERELARQLGGDLAGLRCRSVEVSPEHQRVFQIDISKFEFCQGRATVEVDHYQLQVYTPAMIAAEKLRAICQQMPEYAQRVNPAPRPRDFYDIHAIVAAGVRLSSTWSSCGTCSTPRRSRTGSLGSSPGSGRGASTARSGRWWSRPSAARCGRSTSTSTSSAPAQRT